MPSFGLDLGEQITSISNSIISVSVFLSEVFPLAFTGGGFDLGEQNISISFISNSVVVVSEGLLFLVATIALTGGGFRGALGEDLGKAEGL